MICAAAGELGRAVHYPTYWAGIIEVAGAELVIPERYVEEIKARWPSLNARVVHD